MKRPESSSPASDEALNDIAARWIAQCESGLSERDAATLAAWRGADPRHEAAFQRAERTQRLLSRLPHSPAAAALLGEVEDLCRAHRHRQPTIPWWQIGTALAAAACLALVVWFARPSGPADPTTYATDASGHQSIALADGSTLVLNAASTVEVAFAQTERRVRLTRGEAHFYVAKDPARPFLVSAGVVTVRAVGTAFNVRHSPSTIEVLVTEGKVQVSRHDAAAPAANEPAPIFLVAGERALIDSMSGIVRSDRIAPGDAARPDAQVLWPAPRLVFSNTPLAEVVARFNRYNTVQMEIADPELGLRAVAGNFDADKAETFLNLLETSGDIRVERASPTRVVLHPGR